MDRERLTYYKDKLIKEKKRVNEAIEQLNDNDMTKYNVDIASELSFYDNHPSDIATETFQVEMGRSLEANETSMLDKINDALKAIDEGSYGKCKKCGKDIEEERLEALPYAENCIRCQQTISAERTYNSTRRVPEESVLRPLGFGFTHYNEGEIGVDAEDTYQMVQMFDRNKDITGYHNEDDDYVEEVERISNQEYKNQLPD
ncbi:TraR/DksA C4-type zinc finger protein [Clostridium oryzae]|uniref:General stress protein 16O n=1 Tax=Clostridium oryzae TaxID=1450648 RepID=A0A1V4IRF9_9CLOT|nr:TraR/DksA C4-type zinc finger protein [Clostridium oryzae]OPJ62394.1 general stress protein 16O [Clostridium oryzae]